MQKEQLHRCFNCGNVSTHKLINEIEVQENVYDIDNQYATFGYNYYYFFDCLSCGRVSIFADFFTANPTKSNSIRDLELLHPQFRNVESLLPQAIRHSYHEAKKVQNVSAESFIILMRKCLEQVCDDQKAVGSNLFSKINNLIEGRILPKKVGEFANLIRELGNISAHDSEYAMDFMDVDIIDELFLIIAEYVYDKNSSFDSLKAKWDHLRNRE